MPKRRRNDIDNTAVRRSTNACHRCKSKKIKCYFSDASLQSTCVACIKSRTDCVFDVTPDGVPRGAEYVASLESRIASLEEQLRAANQVSSIPERVDLSNVVPVTLDNLQGQDLSSHDTTHSGVRSSTGPTGETRHDANAFDSQIITSPSAASRNTGTGQTQAQHKVIESASDGITIFNFLSHPPVPSDSEDSSLPELPTEKLANELLETTYVYTQGRYCLVDWIQVREWYQRRESICNAASAGDQEAQTGSYFIWMVCAIGAQLISCPQGTPAGYYSRALKHLPAILSQQNLTTLQALLVLVQYFYRSPGGPSIWHLAGAAMRLCVELGLHRRALRITDTATADPYMTEVKKRLFWCAYCFDRSVSIISKRPFSIQDVDIDVELPVDIDVLFLDRQVIRDRQVMQAAAEPSPQEGRPSTITASLNHLRMYRLQSRIITRFVGTYAPALTSEEAWKFLQELDDWRERVSRDKFPLNFPHQEYESLQASYYMTALLLLRPTLARPSVDEHLLRRCATLSADACENEKALCFSPQTHNSPVRIYNCFRCGLTLLQCLAIRPTILPARSALRAINSCSSALSVYTGALAVARSYLQLFDQLSDHFFGYDEDGALRHPNDNLRSLLQRVTSCDPSEIPELLKSLSIEETSRSIPLQHSDTDTVGQEDASRVMYPAPGFGMDLITPFEILDDSLRPDLFQEDMMGFWGGSFTL